MPFPNPSKTTFNGVGRYGFFNSHRSQVVVEGETKYTYDRTYTNEDMNAYTKGLVSRNGLFNQSGNMTSSEPRTDRQYTAFGVKVDADNYILGEAVGEYPAGSYYATILPGKGLVNYHWFYINEGQNNGMPIYFDPSGSEYDRADKISVRWDNNDRTVRVVVEKGDPSSTLKDGSDPKRTEELNLGMVQNRSWKVDSEGHDVGFYTAKEPGTNHDIMEITIGYMYIRGQAWVRKNPNKCRIWFRDMRGEKYCPWITHITWGPSSKDLDEKIRQYNDVIAQWIADMTVLGDLGMRLSTVKLHVNGGPNVSNSLNITEYAQQSGYTDYVYSSDHTVMVYYNGLLMSIENNEYSLTNQGVLTINNNNSNTIPVNNMLDIVILVGSTLSIPNGDDIFY